MRPCAALCMVLREDGDAARLGDVGIAYEPNWAIGTGLVATPDQAAPAVESA